MANKVLKNPVGDILDPHVPRYEKYKVIEIVENEKGIAIKYENGIMICSAISEISFQKDKADNATYCYVNGRVDFPESFIEKPLYVYTDVRSKSGGIFVCSPGGDNQIYEDYMNTRLISFNAVTQAIMLVVNAFAIGKWK